MEVLDLVSLPTDRNLTGLRSDHEEADTRIVLHARDATIRGYQQINVVCRDTDAPFFSLHTYQISLQLFWCLLGQPNWSFMFQFIKSASVKKHEIPFWLFIRSLVATPLASLLALVSSHLGAYLSRVLGYYSILEKMKVQKRRCFVMPKPSSANCTTKAQRKPWSTARGHQRSGEQRKAWIPSLQLKMHWIFTSSERTIRHIILISIVGKLVSVIWATWLA